MRNLSVMEQKQVVGGNYTLKVYSYRTHDYVVLNTEASWWDVTVAKWDYRDKNGYHIIVRDNDTNRVIYDSADK